MKPDRIKYLIESDLELTAKVVIVANYFDSFCSSSEIIELIENPKTNISVIREILKLFSQDLFYKCNNKLVDALITVYQNRNRYSNDHLKEVISGMGIHDVPFMYDKLIEDPPKYFSTISDSSLYGANVEYLANLISNNKYRLMPVVTALASAAQESSWPRNLAYLTLMDICYVFSKDVINNLPIDVATKITAIGNGVTAKTLTEYLREIFSAWPNIKFYYYDYNSTFESIHARFHSNAQFQKEASTEIGNVAAIKKVVIDNTPVTSLMLNKSELENLSVFTGVGSSGSVHIIPCFCHGDLKGMVLLNIEDNQPVGLPYLLGAIIIGKHVAKLVHETAEELSPIKYYYDFVQHQSISVNSLEHEVNFALGILKDSARSLQPRDEHDAAIDEIKVASQIIGDAVQSMKEYTSPLIEGKGINEVINNLLTQFKTYIKKEKVNIHFDRDENNGVIVSGTSIYTILSNLLRNSIEATKGNDKLPSLEKKIRISATSTHDIVSVTIADNGSGIKPDLREKILKENVTTWGHGAGLLTVKFLLDEMGGVLEIGNPAAGAEFTVSLPRMRP